ncbi:MAG: SdpI family protein [Bacteroidota bacterium]
MFTFLLIYFLVGLLFIFISLPLIKRKIKINHWYGIRLPQTMKDERIWYEVNARSGKHLLILGIIICLLSILFYLGDFFTLIVTTVLFTIIVLVGVIIIAIMAFAITSKVSKQAN